MRSLLIKLTTTIQLHVFIRNSSKQGENCFITLFVISRMKQIKLTRLNIEQYFRREQISME